MVQRTIAILMLALLGVSEGYAQEDVSRPLDLTSLTVIGEVPAPPPESVCRLHPGEHRGTHYLSTPEPVRTLGKTATATINVTYSGFTPEAQAAFQRAVDTWALLLTSPVTINIDATFEPLGPGVLGSAGPTDAFILTGFSDGIPRAVGVPLAEALVAGDLNTPGDPDISANFNSTFSWHFGTEAPPSGSGTFDFESVVLHELGHGLNFIRFADVDDGDSSNGTECTGVAGDGCMDLDDGPDVLYGINDTFFIDGSGNLLRDTGVYADPSADLGDALTGEVGGVFFSGSNAANENGGTAPEIYAPSTFAPGSSLSHLDENTFNGTLSALMTPFFAPEEIARTPGPVTCGIFADVLWTIDQTTCNGLPLPVELTAFDAVADGEAVTLRWETASETNNAGFEVQRLRMREPETNRGGDEGEGAWQALGFVEGHGTTAEPQRYAYQVGDLAPGTHTFRLRQVDFDGTFEYSPEVEVAVEMAAAYRLTPAHPNPFNPTTQFSVAVQRAQHVRIDVYDVTGRRVRTLFDGRLAAQQTRTVVFDGDGLPSGLYYLRARGQTFSATEAVVRTK